MKLMNEAKPAVTNLQETPRLITAPNVLTGIRILLTIPFLYLASTGRYGLALCIFFVAAITDFFDGYLARRLRQFSTLGRFLDPAADKLLTTASFVVLAIPWSGQPSLPIWLAAMVVSRDLFILAGSLAVYLATGFKKFKPRMLGKVNTFIEMGLVVWYLALHAAGVLTEVLPVLYGIVACSVFVSGVDYLIYGFALLRRKSDQGPTS
jgi:cardiolipin synthase